MSPAVESAQSGGPVDPASCPGDLDETVYLRRQAQGWSLALGVEALGFFSDDDIAFEHACAVARRPDGSPRRLEILTGPSAELGMAVHQRDSAILGTEQDLHAAPLASSASTGTLGP